MRSVVAIWIGLSALNWSVALCEEAPRPTPDSDTERLRAFALLADGHADQAADVFSRLLAEDPEDAASIEGHVRSLLRLQRWREALSEAREQTVKLEDAVEVTTALAEALFRAGRLEEIDAVLAPLATRDDAPGRALAVLGRLREAEGRDAEAVELMRRAVEASPDDRDVLYWAAGATPTRAAAAERLERYLELSRGDEPESIEAAGGWLDLMRLLGERPVWIPEGRPERLEVPLQRIWDSVTGVTQGFVIRVALGDKGKPVRLLLDSGAPGLYVIRRLSKKRGFEPLSEQAAFGGGGSGRHLTTRGMFSSVAIGGLRFRDALATTNKQELDPTGRYHGVLGLAVFDGYRVTLDLENDRLLLDAPAEVPEGEPYWMVGGQFLVKAVIDGAAPGMFLFDTGATRTLIDSALASEVEGARFGPAVALQGFGGRLPGVRRLDGVVVTFQGLSPEGSVRAADLSMRSRVGGLEISGFLGLDLWNRSRLVVDTTRRRVLVKPGNDRRD
jgi:tetratricopeptide (TPR) repeat protein